MKTRAEIEAGYGVSLFEDSAVNNPQWAEEIHKLRTEHEIACQIADLNESIVVGSGGSPVKTRSDIEAGYAVILPEESSVNSSEWAEKIHSLKTQHEIACQLADLNQNISVLQAGGSDKQVQYNNAGKFGGINNGNADEVLVSNGAAAFPSFKVFGKVLYGASAPTTEGVDGDFYIRTATNYIYGPKASGTWPGGISLVGPAGTPGVGLVAVGAIGNAVNNLGAEVTVAAGTAPFNITAGALNALGRKLIIRGSGYLTTAGGETPTFTILCKFGGVSIGTFTTGNLTASKTIKFDFIFEASVNGIGATGTVITRGVLNIDLAGDGTYITYRNISIAGAGNIDLTGLAGVVVRASSSANISVCNIDEVTSQAF